jgi:hypothetical protein
MDNTPSAGVAKPKTTKLFGDAGRHWRDMETTLPAQDGQI